MAVNINKHNVLLFLCIVFLLALAFRNSLTQYIPYTHHTIENYEERSYTLDIGSIADQIQSDYQKRMLDRKTVFGKSQGQNAGKGSGDNITQDNEGVACQGLFKCGQSKLLDSSNAMSTENINATTSSTTSSTTPSTSLASANTVVPSNQQTTCDCPPQLSLEDMLSLDLWNAEEKAMQQAMADSQSVRDAAASTVKEYQDTLRDAMMDGFAKTNALTNASNMLETAIQQQTISGNMPDAMKDGINAATQPITEKVNDLSNVVQQMKAIVDRTRARCNSVRFAFGRGCRI
jgi:hypothetical protein